VDAVADRQMRERPVMNRRFYIHHDELARKDLRFKSVPSFPRYLTVDLISDDIEQTYTKTIETMEGPWHAEIRPRPKGFGWTVHQESNGHTVWRRPHDPGAYFGKSNGRERPKELLNVRPATLGLPPKG
jgi:hypothetical protein